MKSLTNFKVLMAMTIFSIAIAGCKKEVAVTGVTVSPTTVSLHQGGTQQLTATVQPSDATNKTVTWSSGNTARATVSEAGMVTIPANATTGEVAITATTADGGFTANCTVSVSIVVTSIAISGYETVEEGKTITLTATVEPSTASNKSVTWSSLNTGVASVNAQTGVVTGVSEGTANIRATAADGSGVTADKSVTVTAAPVRSVSVGAQVGTLIEGTEGTVTFPVAISNIANGTYTATVANLPAGVSVQGNVYISSNAGTLTLAGNVSTSAGETTTLTLTIDGKTSESFTLTIVEIQKSVTVGAQNGTLTTNRANTVTFPVTTTNIANGRTGAVGWYANAEGTISSGAPTGITASVSNVASNSATLTVNTTAAIMSGTYYFRVTIDGEQSNVTTLTVSGTGSPWNIGHPGYNSNVVATLSGNTLTISGSGNMVDFWNSTEGEAPWWFNPSDRNAITTVVIQNGVTNIGNRAFKDCSNLETITIANSVTIIGRRVFDKCTKLTSITIPNGVTQIEGEAFYDCSSLQTVTIANGSGQLNFSAFNYQGNEYPKGYKYGWFEGSTIQTLHLGRNYTNAGSTSPFSGISTLQALTIGNTVTFIDRNAFSSCRSLESVTLQDGLDDLKFDYVGNSYADCPIQTLHLGRNMISNYDYGQDFRFGASPFSEKKELSSLTIGNNVTFILANVFYGCTALTDIVIPNKVTSVGGSAFYGCNELKSIVIGSGIKTIENSTFYGCSKLSSITIPSNITFIDRNAFANCRSLVNVRIEDGLDDLTFDYVGNSFADCPIQTLHLGRNVIGNYQFGNDFFWGTSPFQEKKELTTLTIGNTVKTIVAKVFSGCSALTQITSNPAIPPTIYTDTFNSVSKSIPVRVSSSSVSSYRGAPYWSAFTNYQGF